MKTKPIEVFEVIGVDGEIKQVVETTNGVYCLTCNSQFCVHCYVVEKNLENEEN